jgi:hypothetical protein
MRRRIVLTGMVVGLAVALFAPAAGAGRVDYRAPLSHAQETLDVRAPGAGGHAEFWVEGTTLHYRIDVRHLTGPATMAHIHAPAGRHADAGIAVWLCGTTPLPGPAGTPVCGTATTGSLVQGSVSVTLQQLAWMDTGQAYVNVHTAVHPPGEVRGQILRLGRR